MGEFKGIRACVFDAYGTLFDVNAPMKRLAREIGPKAEEISALWRRKQLEYTWLRSLMGVHADFWKVTGDALDYALGVHEIEDDGLRDQLLTLYLKLEAYPDAAPALKAVRSRGMATAILSNGSPSMLDQALKASGLETYFTHVISVEDVGIYKPSRRVYRHGLHKMGLQEASAICFVSANPWDAQGAQVFGFQAVRIDRAGSPDERLPGKPSARIESLAELPALIAS